MIVLNFPLRCISKDNEHIQNSKGRYFLSDRYKQFENNIALYAKNQYDGIVIKGDIILILEVYFKDKRHSDATNLFKGVCDALEGIIYTNDRQIKEATIKVNEKHIEDCFSVTIASIKQQKK